MFSDSYLFFSFPLSVDNGISLQSINLETRCFFQPIPSGCFQTCHMYLHNSSEQAIFFLPEYHNSCSELHIIISHLNYCTLFQSGPVSRFNLLIPFQMLFLDSFSWLIALTDPLLPTSFFWLCLLTYSYPLPFRPFTI